MPRYRQPYTYYTRTTKKGVKVFYYQTYDTNGNRTGPISTGCSTKARFMDHMNQLIRDGKLLPDRSPNPTFADYTATWWLWDACPYISRQLARNPRSLTPEYAQSRRSELVQHLHPAFGSVKIKAITTRMIEEWLMQMKAVGKKSDATINHALKNLKKILSEAARLGDIPVDVGKPVPLLHEEHARRGILTLQEVRRLLNDEALETIWDGHLVHFTLNLTAAATGMRQSELLALTAQEVHTTHVEVNHAYRPTSRLKGTKTSRTRIVPIPSRVSAYLTQLAGTTNQFLFSLDAGVTPIASRTVTRALYRALGRIGIDELERKERGIVFHSWRHFFNTYCRGNNISDAKVQAITGHMTQRMTDQYTQFDLEHYQDIAASQERLWEEQE